MLVYRYEWPDEQGPYRWEVYDLSRKLYAMKQAHQDDEHPGHQDYPDSWGVEHNDMRAACASIQQLKQWFKGYNAELIRQGFYMVELEVSHVEYGISGRQCRFHIDDVISQRIL